jgi:broad specificity phosphatase PhoE
MQEKAIMVRHLKDLNNLLEGFDGGLTVDQDQISVELAKSIFETAKEKNVHHIDIITSDQKRTLETSRLILDDLEKLSPGENSIIVDDGLRGLNQGVPILPKDYNAGDEFPPLKTAWGPFWQHVKDGDIFYRFGEDEVANSLFKESGESYADIVYRHLEFIHRFSLENEVNPDKLVVLVGHSINIRIIKEIVSVAKVHNSVLNPIPLGNITKMMEEYWDKKRPGYGELEIIDLTALTDGLTIDQIDQELHILKAKMVQQQGKN